MDPRDLPPMRSGLGLPGQATNDPGQEAVARRLVSVVAVMTQHAGHLAYRTAVHERRDMASHEDVNAALKHQARHFLQTVDSPETMQEIEEMQKMIFYTESVGSNDSDEEEVSSEDTSEDFSEDSEKAVYEDGKCVCASCVEVRAAVDTWDSWHPVDIAEKYLKDSVDKAIASATAKMTLIDDE